MSSVLFSCQTHPKGMSTSLRNKKKYALQNQQSQSSDFYVDKGKYWISDFLFCKAKPNIVRKKEESRKKKKETKKKKEERSKKEGEKEREREKEEEKETEIEKELEKEKERTRA